MSKKESIKISLTVFFLIIAIIVIILMGILIYKFNEEKNLEVQKVSKLTIEVNELKENINELQEKLKNVKKENNNIVFDGCYGIPDSDFLGNLTKDGRVVFGGNMDANQGTYKTIGKNIVEIHYTTNAIWDEETGECIITDIDLYQYIYIDEDSNIYLIDHKGNSSLIKRFGDVNEENFIN